MLEWKEYISQLLRKPCSLDGITLSFSDNDDEAVTFPPIIKASISMLDQMMEKQGNLNIFVFPERIQSIFIFTLATLLHNIFDGKITRSYDPDSFTPGERLRIGKAVVEFKGVENRGSQKCMRIGFDDNLVSSAPVEYFPLFQKTTAQRLSKYRKYAEEKKKMAQELTKITTERSNMKKLLDYKTHMERSVVNMTSVINAKDLISRCSLDGQKVKDIVLVGQADYEGRIKNIGAGQLGGIPAVVLASDLYAIAAMARQRHPIQSVIIDASNANALLAQMDALDELIRLGIPITCVTDTVNSFELGPFLDRQFHIWRWDAGSITEKLYGASSLNSDKKIKYCATHKVEYLLVGGNEISMAMQKISLHKGDNQNMSPQMLKLFDSLNSLIFLVLRETAPFDSTQIRRAQTILEESSRILMDEKAFLAPETEDDYAEVIRCLKTVFSRSYTLQKFVALKEKFLSACYEKVCIVVPERADKVRIEYYWQQWCRRKGLRTKVFVLHPAEYYPSQCGVFSATIVVGWMKRAIMRKILYSFNTQNYVILLYDCEKRWQRYTTARWNAVLDSTRNREMIEKAFTTDTLHISTSRFRPGPKVTEDIPENDELAEIETLLQENKYRRYVASRGQKSVEETAEAIPVNFIGGYLTFYRLRHKVISASNIIFNDGDEIKSIFPNELKLGDFVVVREADRDLIKEMADIILEQERAGKARDTATKWKDALKIEALFCSPDDIHKKLQAVGCTKGYQTVRGWLTDEDVICPSDKDDLRYIAAVTESAVLNELFDKIYEAAQIVRSAHIKAGRELSQRLRVQITEKIKEYGDIDPFNIWDPIEMSIEGIGIVRVLKIIDIGAPVVVEASNTNRLLDEDQGALLWQS